MCVLQQNRALDWQTGIEGNHAHTHWHRRSGLLDVSACDKPQSSPLADLPAPTAARVRAARHAVEHAADRWAVRDTIASTEGLDSFLALVTASGRGRVVDDAPLGYLGLVLRRDNAFVGNLRVGDSWILAFTDDGMDRKPRLRTLSATELASVHRWLGATQGNHKGPCALQPNDAWY
jgi:hypothetical protein